MASAQINGTTIHYEDTGGSGPAVILSHGFLMDHTMFDPQVAALKSTHRVITWDERGFGGTRATGKFTYWDSARDVLGLLDHLGIRALRAIVGASYGGMVALAFGERHPDRVAQLVVVSAADRSHPMSTAWRSVQPSRALEATWNLIRATNAHLERNEPWKMAPGPDVDVVMGDAIEALRIVTILAHPALPTTTQEIWRRLGLSGNIEDRRVGPDTTWGGYPGGLRVEKGEPLFPRKKAETK